MLRSLVLAAAIVSTAASAQTFPNRTLRVVVPQSPGGGFDLVARVLADGLAAELGQPAIVENRPGGGTVLGTELAWAGYFVRSATPAPILARLREAFGRIMASADMAAAPEKRGVRALRISGPEADALLANDLEKWTKLVRSAGISAD